MSVVSPEGEVVTVVSVVSGGMEVPVGAVVEVDEPCELDVVGALDVGAESVSTGAVVAIVSVVLVPSVDPIVGSGTVVEDSSGESLASPVEQTATTKINTSTPAASPPRARRFDSNCFRYPIPQE